MATDPYLSRANRKLEVFDIETTTMPDGTAHRPVVLTREERSFTVWVWDRRRGRWEHWEREHVRWALTHGIDDPPTWNWARRIGVVALSDKRLVVLHKHALSNRNEGRPGLWLEQLELVDNGDRLEIQA